MKKTIKSGVIYNTIYQILVIIAPLITSPYLSRIIGADGIGEYQYRYSIAYYFFLVAMLGVNTYGNREVAKYRDSKEERSKKFWQIYYIQLFLGITLSIVYCLIGALLGVKSSIYYVQVLQIISVCVDINWYAFALEEFKLTTIRSIIIKILSIIAIFVFVKSPSDLFLYACIILGSNVLGLCMIVPLVIKTTIFCKPVLSEIKKHIRPNFVLFLPSIASSVYIYMDKIMLGALSSNSEVGYYNYAENIIAVPYALTTAISTVMLPRVSYLVARKQIDKCKTYLNKSLAYVSILNIALTFGIDAIATIFVPWYLGDEYMYTAELVMIRSPLVLLNGITVILRSQWLIPLNKDKQYSYSIIAGAIINAILNAVLIIQFGAIGASIATVVSFIIICSIQAYYCRNAIEFRKNSKAIILFGLIGLTMFELITLCNHYMVGHNPIIVIAADIIIGAMVYIVSAIIYCIVTKNEDYYILINTIKRILLDRKNM